MKIRTKNVYLLSGEEVEVNMDQPMNTLYIVENVLLGLKRALNLNHAQNFISLSHFGKVGQLCQILTTL